MTLAPFVVINILLAILFALATPWAAMPNLFGAGLIIGMMLDHWIYA